MYDFVPEAQLFLITPVVAVPIATVNILPGSILRTRVRIHAVPQRGNEGMFFGARGSISKLGTSLGVDFQRGAERRKGRREPDRYPRGSLIASGSSSRAARSRASGKATRRRCGGDTR